MDPRADARTTHHPDTAPAEDLAYEREVLDESIRHDYSTSDVGIVPLTRRRPMWHFMGLWTTFVAGFSYMFLGFELHDGGHGLASTVGITAFGYGLYIAYALVGSYLGARTGQTHALLTRSIFGLVGSWIVSAFILVAPLGWVAFQANLLVTLWDGFYGWGHVFTLTLLFAGVMIFNNLFGFTGISVFARYLVTPILILWCIYMVVKAAVHSHGQLGGTPHGSGLPFWVAVTAVIGFSMWGNEPDFWRFGKPKLHLARADVPLRRRLVRPLHDGRLDDGAARGDDRHRGRLPLHRPLLALRRVLARLDHRHRQPVRDQRRQLLRVGQRRPEPDRRLAAVAAAAHVPDRRRRRRDRGRPRQLPFPERLVQGGDLPRDHRALRDGDHGPRPLPAAAALPDLAPAHPRAGVGGDGPDQPARRRRAPRGRVLRRHRHRELAARLDLLDAAERLGAGAARVVADRRCALRGARRGRARGRPGARRARVPAPRARRGDRHRRDRGRGDTGGRIADLLLRNGLVDVGWGEFRRGDVAVSGGRIVERAADDAEVVDCSRFLVVPGMVNAHNHSNENWFRGMWDNLPLEPWMLFSYPVLAAPAQSADEIYLRTMLGAIEQLRSGATCVVDFLYELDGFTDESLEAVVRAYRDVGLRALIALGIGDRAYHETVVLDEGLVSRDLLARLERDAPPSWPEWERFVRAAIERFHRPDERISICPAPSGPQRCTDEMLVGCADLAEELDLVLHIHVLETRMQAVSGQRMYGRTLVEHMDAIGFLSPRVCFAHGIWLTPYDMELVRDRDVTIAHNPVSNLKLGSGIAPVPRLLAHGVNVALGTDGMSSNEGLDMFASLKLCALVHKLWGIDYEQWLGAREAWQLATIGGARAAGDPGGLGRIEPGRRADLVLLDLESSVFTPLNDPLRQLAFGSTTSAVDSVLVGGRWVVRSGRLTTVDEADVLARAREVGKEIVGRFDEAFEVGRQLLAPLRGGWLEALRTGVGVERKLAL